MAGSGRGTWYWRPSYLGYSLGCAVAWAVIWLLLWILASTRTVHVMGYVFLGWVIGWVSASIARIVYPAPRHTLLRRAHREAGSGD